MRTTQISLAPLNAGRDAILQHSRRLRRRRRLTAAHAQVAEHVGVGGGGRRHPYGGEQEDRGEDELDTHSV